MKKFLFSIMLLVSTFCVFAQTSVNDFITKPSMQMPSFTALQKEQFRTSFNYQIATEFFGRSDVFTMSNEFNFDKINSGFGINYENFSFDKYYQRNLNLSYNYKIKTQNATFIPAISYENFAYNIIENLDSNMISSSISSYSLVNTSFVFEVKNLTIGLGLKNLNQPKVYGLNYEYTIPIKYQILANYKFFTKNKFIDYLQLAVYNEFYKYDNIKDYYYTSSLGLNSKFKIVRFGFDVNFSNGFPQNYNFRIEKANYFVGIEKDNFNFYYSLNQTYSMIFSSSSDYRIHNFTLAVNFDIFKKKSN